MARDDEWTYSDGGDEDEWEYSEAPGALRTFGRSFRQGINPLWDEGAGFMGANIDAGKHLLETGSVVTPTEWLEGYRRNRDESRDTDARGAQANPTAATTGRVTGAVVQGLASGGAGGVGRGLVSAVTSGATQGAVNALAGSEADLTRLNAENYARAATDTLKGGAAGAIGGGVGYGVGKGLAYVGGKAVDAYRGARGTLEGEVRAGMEAEEAALRAGDDAADVRMGREQGRAMEMNKVVDSRAAREEARVAARAQRTAQTPSGPRPSPAPGEPFPPGQYPGRRRFVGDPNADPDTNVLKGYEGGAHRRRVDNAPKVRDARAQLARPDVTPAERAELEAYVGRHGDAVDNPPAFRLRIIEDELVRRGYSPDVVRRAMARFDADGRAVSRGARPPEQAALPERTQVAEGSDWLKRGHDMEELARQGGGGSALDGLSEAKTRMALIRTSPPEGVHGTAMERYGDNHLFEFRAPDGTIFEANVDYSHAFPDELIVNSIHPKGATGSNYIAMGEEYAGRNGPGNMRQLLDELKRQFPEAKKILAERMSGWNPKRDMEMRMPGLKPEAPTTYEFPGRSGASPAQRQLSSDEGHGPYKNWPENEPTANDPWPDGAGDGLDDVVPRPAPSPPPVDEVTEPGAPSFPPSVQPYDVLEGLPAVKPGAGRHWGEQRPSAQPLEDIRAAEAMAARRAAAFGSRPDGPAPEATAGSRPRAMPEQSASMRAPEDGPLPPEATATDPRFEATQAEFTRATRVPEVRRAPMRPDVQPPPEATQVGGPSAFTDRTRYAPPDMAQRLAGRPSVDSLVDERIAGGGQALRSAFSRGATGEGSAALGLAGLALGGPTGSLKALALRGGLEVVREALRNPAAKARAIEVFKLQRLATIRPEVWGRVSATLQRAAQRDEESGTDYHARAARHALLQTDPAFRAAEAEAAKELQGLSEEELTRRLAR